MKEGPPFASGKRRPDALSISIAKPETGGANIRPKNLSDLFDAFEEIATHGVVSRPVPAKFGMEGFFFRYARHLVYWRRSSNGDMGIVAILHERMQQLDRFQDDFGIN